MTISRVHNSFRWLVTPLVCVLLMCQVLAICIVSVTLPSLHTTSESPGYLNTHDHGGTQHTLNFEYTRGAESGQQSASTPAPSISVPVMPDRSSPHIAEHDCCDNNEDALRAAIFILLAFGVVLLLLHIVGAPGIRFSVAASRHSRQTEYGYPRPHLVYCKLLN